MPSMSCSRCGSVAVTLRSTASDGKKHFRCDDCHNRWTSGGGRATQPGTRRAKKSIGGFLSPIELSPEQGQARFEALVSRFRDADHSLILRDRKWRAEMHERLSRTNIGLASPQTLRDIASPILASPGQQTVFYSSWKKHGDEQAVALLRKTIDFLLWADGALEQRIDAVMQERDGLGMPGFKEALITKVLCIGMPERFLSILTVSSGAGGKLEFMQHVWGARLVVSGTQADQIVSSNDRLLERMGDRFADTVVAAGFLWWTRTEP